MIAFHSFSFYKSGFLKSILAKALYSMDHFIRILLLFHILCGSLSLISSALSISSRKGQRTHRFFGKIYFWGMVGVFLTAIPLAIFKLNVFLLLIAIFSFYLAFAGMRFTVNRKGIPKLIDWIAVILMCCSGIAMLLLGLKYYFNGNTQYMTLLVFGSIALFLSYNDYVSFKKRNAIGKNRIIRHLTNMLAGTIAVITAFLVTNFRTEPEWILWVLPTMLITPIIIWWNVRMLNKSNPY